MSCTLCFWYEHLSLLNTIVLLREPLWRATSWSWLCWLYISVKLFMKVLNDLKFTADLPWKENMCMRVGAMLLEENENGSRDCSFLISSYFIFSNKHAFSTFEKKKIHTSITTPPPPYIPVSDRVTSSKTNFNKKKKLHFEECV